VKRKKQSKPLTGRIGEADETRLWSWFAGYVEQAMKLYDVTAFKILHPGLHKRKPEVRARRDIVLAMRKTVWWRDTSEQVGVHPANWGNNLDTLFTHHKAVRLLHFGEAPHPPRDAWQPISFPMLAALFVNCNHSTILLLHQEACKHAVEAAAGRSGKVN